MEKGKALIFRIVVVFFLTTLFFWGYPKLTGQTLERVEELQREIRVLNLINGLDLTEKQMNMILSNAEEVRQLREQFKSTALSRQEEMGILLEEIRGYLGAKNEIPASTTQRFRQLNREVREAQMEMKNRVEQLAKDIEEQLESHQLYQIEHFIPCIIPPKGEVRIGQADDHLGITRSLERIRRIPARLYHLRKEEIFRRTFEGMKLHATPDAEISEEEARRHVLNLYDEARRLDEAEFEIQKKKLARELISPFKPDRPPPRLDRKIAAFLLSPEVITILEERKKGGIPEGDTFSSCHSKIQ